MGTLNDGSAMELDQWTTEYLVRVLTRGFSLVLCCWVVCCKDALLVLWWWGLIGDDEHCHEGCSKTLHYRYTKFNSNIEHSYSPGQSSSTLPHVSKLTSPIAKPIYFLFTQPAPSGKS